MKSKHDLSIEEEKLELINNANRYASINPNQVLFESINLDFWQNKLDEAKKEGYKSEKCECGICFLAFHHLTTCNASDCPFSDHISLLDRLENIQ